MMKRLYHGQILDEITFNDIVDHFRGLEKMKVEKMENKYVYENGSSVTFLPKTETENEKILYEIIEHAEGYPLSTSDYLTYDAMPIPEVIEIKDIRLKDDLDGVIAASKYDFNPENLSVTFTDKQTYSRVYLAGFSFKISKTYEMVRDEFGNITSGEFDLSEIILLNEIGKKAGGTSTSSFDVFNARFNENIVLNNNETIRLNFDQNTAGNRFYHEDGCFVANSPMYADFRVNLDVQAAADSRLYISYQIIKKDGTDGIRSFIYGQRLTGWTVITGQKVLYLDEGDKVYVDVRVNHANGGTFTLEADDSFINAIIYTNNVPFGGSGSDTTLHGIPVKKPSSEDHGKILSYDHANNQFIWVENKAGAEVDGEMIVPDGVNIPELFDNDENTYANITAYVGSEHFGQVIQFNNPTELVSKIRFKSENGYSDGAPYKVLLEIYYIDDGQQNTKLDVLLSKEEEMTVNLPFPMSLDWFSIKIIDTHSEGSAIVGGAYGSDYRWGLSEIKLLK